METQNATGQNPATQPQPFALPPQVTAMMPMLIGLIPDETIRGIAVSKITALLQAKLDKLLVENPNTNGIAFLLIPEIVDKKIVEVQFVLGRTNSTNTAIETPIEAFNLFDKINHTSKEDLMKSFS